MSAPYSNISPFRIRIKSCLTAFSCLFFIYFSASYSAFHFPDISLCYSPLLLSESFFFLTFLLFLSLFSISLAHLRSRFLYRHFFSFNSSFFFSSFSLLFGITNFNLLLLLFFILPSSSVFSSYLFVLFRIVLNLISLQFSLVLPSLFFFSISRCSVISGPSSSTSLLNVMICTLVWKGSMAEWCRTVALASRQRNVAITDQTLVQNPITVTDERYCM